jgi:Fe-S-cluster containining protein
MKTSKPFPVPVRVAYSCSKSPAYCSTYAEIEVTARDIARLARHFQVDYGQAEARYTKPKAGAAGARLLRHRKDDVYDSTCMLLDQEKRRCTVYEARPAVCRAYPDAARCGYYDFLEFEREQQGDPAFVARA